MPFVSSQRIHELVEKRAAAGMIPRLKKLCTKVVHGGDQSIRWMEKGILLCEEFSISPVTIVKVTLKVDMFFFDLSVHSEDEWVEKLESLQIKTGKHQLAKMVASRISDCRKAHCAGVSGFEFPTLDNKAALVEFAQNELFNFWFWRDRSIENKINVNEVYETYRAHCKAMNRIKKVAARDDVDDAILKHAWGLVVAGEIMES